MPARRPIVYLLFFLSGATGLVYELIWTRELILLVGGTTYAITTVLVAFMAGLALGSYVSGRLSGRLRRPERVYGLLEIGVGVYALAVPLMFRLAEPLYRAVYPLVDQSPWVLTATHFGVGAFVLIVPATCMGATLPLLVRYVTAAGAGLGRSAGLLYGINTCGAVAGTLLAGFVLLPQFGLSHSTHIAAGANLFIGMAALTLLRPRGAAVSKPLLSETGTPSPTLANSLSPNPGNPPARRRCHMGFGIGSQPTAATKDAHHAKSRDPSTAAIDLPTTTAQVQRARNIVQAVLLVAAISGFASMVYQIAWTRALVMSIGSSTYSFTCILAAFILGLGVGSLVIARWADRWKNPAAWIAVLEIGIALAAIVIVPIHGRIPAIVNHIVQARQGNYTALLATEFALVIAVTFVPTLLMGAIFPLVARVVNTTSSDSGAAVGRAYAVNTVGTIVGSFIAGFVMIRGDVLGVQYSIVAAALANALVGAWLLIVARPAGRSMGGPAFAGGAALATVLVVAWISGEWDRELLTSAPFFLGQKAPQREVEYYFEDVDMTVSVERIGGPRGNLTLSVNGKADASTGPQDLRTQLLVAHLPALLDRRGTSACVIGLGSGMTVGSLARYSSYKRIVCAELSEAVIAAAERFKEHTYDILHSDPRIDLVRTDGRNLLLLSPETFDVIVSEPSNPWIAGVSNLFTREFFELCRSRLSDDGVLAVWLQSYSTSRANFQMVVRTLFEVFDFVSIWEAGAQDFCLIAGRQSTPMPLSIVQARYAQPGVSGDLYRIALRDLGSVLGNYVTSGKPLRDWAADASIHTDDNALLEFSAPLNLYRREHTTIAEALLRLQGSPLGTVVQVNSDEENITALRDQIDAMVDSRHVRVEAADAWEQGREADAMRLLIDAYRAHPGNFLLFEQMMQFTAWLERRRMPAELRELVQQMDALSVPAVAPPGGTDRAGMAAILQNLAQEAALRQQWATAEEYLRQARELIPESGPLMAILVYVLQQQNRTPQAVELIEAFLARHPHDADAIYAAACLYAAAGDADKALAWLETLVQEGKMTAAELAQDANLKNLANNPRFQALMVAAASGPATP